MSGSCNTWTCLYSTYLKSGTTGNCSQVVCHAQMSSASAAYTYLQGRGQMGMPPKITAAGSCLTWYGGNMPPGGPSKMAQAVTDMNAWAAAGAQNN